MPSFNNEIEIMQENLCDLRKIAGDTAESFSRKINVTKQTVSNLETGKVSMSRIQYIAIRSVLECETYRQKDNVALRHIMRFLFEQPYNMYQNNKAEIRTAMVSIASSANAGLSRLQLYSVTVTLLSPLGYKELNHTKPQRSVPTLEWLLRLEEEQDEDN